MFKGFIILKMVNVLVVIFGDVFHRTNNIILLVYKKKKHITVYCFIVLYSDFKADLINMVISLVF